MSHDYLVNRLSSLAVLLGKANDFDRTKILLTVYDDFSNDSLESAEVYNMISEIFNVSLDYIPKLAVILCPNDKQLALQASELITNKVQVIYYLLSKFKQPDYKIKEIQVIIYQFAITLVIYDVARRTNSTL